MKIIKPTRVLLLEFITDSNQIIRMQLDPGKKYVISDGVGVRTQQLYGATSFEVVQDLKDATNRYNGQDLTNKKLISIREGGAGDLLFKTPVFRYLKEKYPTCTITISCSPLYHSLFNNHPHISIVYAHVLPYEEFVRYDYFATFEGLIETNKDAEYINAYDLYIERYGLSSSEIKDKTPVLVVSEETKDFWKFVLGRKLEGKKIGFQWRASSPIRTLPPYLNAQIIKGLTDLGYKVFLIDAVTRKHDVASFIHEYKLDVVDTSIYSDNFERMAGLISLMDMYIGPDSSGTHIAAALGKPIVGLYGPFRSELRLKYYKNSVGIDVIAKKCGKGCFTHTYDLCEFAYELGESFSPCWKLMHPEVVVTEANKLYNKVYNT